MIYTGNRALHSGAYSGVLPFTPVIFKQSQIHGGEIYPITKKQFGLFCIYFSRLLMTHMPEEDAEIGVGVWLDGGLEHWKENVLQHLAKVGHKVPASKDVAKIEEGRNKTHFRYQFYPYFTHFEPFFKL